MKHVDRDSFSLESNSKPVHFDFDAWQKLAQSDPEEFELRRRMLLNGLVEKLSCRDETLLKMRAHIEQQRNMQPPREVLPQAMQELAKAFKQLNAEFSFRAKRWTN